MLIPQIFAFQQISMDSISHANIHVSCNGKSKDIMHIVCSIKI